MQMKRYNVIRTAVVELSGRFDAHTAPLVELWLEQVAAIVPAHAIIDFSKVTFIDSQALRTLITGMKRCREEQGDLYLAAISQPVRIILELTRFDQVFPIFATVEEAVESFANPRPSEPSQGKISYL